MDQQYSGTGNQYPGGYVGGHVGNVGPATNGPVTGATPQPVSQPYYPGQMVNNSAAGNPQQPLPPRSSLPGGVSTGPPISYAGVPGKAAGAANFGVTQGMNYGLPASQYGSVASHAPVSYPSGAPGVGSSLGPPPPSGRPLSQQGQSGLPVGHSPAQTGQSGPSIGRPSSQLGQPGSATIGHPSVQTMGRPPSQAGQFGSPMGQPVSQPGHVAQPMGQAPSQPGQFGSSMGRPPSQQGPPGPQMGHGPYQMGQSGPPMGQPTGQPGHMAPPMGQPTSQPGHMAQPMSQPGQMAPPMGQPASHQGNQGPAMFNHRPPAVNGLHSGGSQASVSSTFTPGFTPGGQPGVVRPPQPVGPPTGFNQSGPGTTGYQGVNTVGQTGGLVRPPPPTNIHNSFSTAGAPHLTNNISSASPTPLGVSAGYQGPPRAPQPGPPPPSLYNSTSLQGPPTSTAQPGMHPLPSIRGPPPVSSGLAPPRLGGPPPTVGGGGATRTLGPPPATSAANRPGELPIPFHGAAEFSHQNQNDLITPSGSEPPGSQFSSRSHTPQQPQPNYDHLEGQFTPSTSGPPSNLPQQAQFYPPQQQQQQQQHNQQYPQHPGVMPPVPTYKQQQGQGHGGPYPPQSGYAPQEALGGYNAPPPPGGYGPAPGPPSSVPSQPGVLPPSQSQQKPHYPSPATGHHRHPQQGYPVSAGVSQPGSLVPGMGAMNLQDGSARPLNLLQDRQILSPDGVEQVVPNLPPDYKKCNCSPDVMSCTLNTIPTTQSLLNKSRLPLGVLIHPFKDLSQLPVIQSTVIVRCRSCRTYINPFVSFVDARRWKCNLCFRVNDLPEEFNYDPVSKSYGDPQRRPEIKSGTIEFIAPTEYMLRPPQPAVYLFLLDVSFNAIDTGYLPLFCQTLLDELDRIPGDSRTMVGFLAYDSALYYFGLNEKTSQPQVYVISDLEESLIPHPDDLLVNLEENKSRLIELLERMPSLFEKNLDTGNALGPALSAAYKLMQPTGGRVTVMQTMLPSVGEGALQCREDPNERAGSKVHNLAPVTDFYKKLALDCSGQQIAVDVFMLSSQYSDISTVACISKYSGGSVQYFPGFHTASNPSETDRYENSLRRYLTRKIGFEAVMRIRCTKGLSIHTFHGNFFVRSTDLLSLPNINPEAGFGMQLSIDDTIESNYVCFQAALLYTSSKAERRIRVHTLCVPVTAQLSEVHSSADQKSIVALLAKMAVDKSVSASLGDAREAMINSVIDMLNSYSASLNSAQRVGQVPCPYQLRLVPLYVIAMLKSMAFRVGTSTKLDERVHAQELCKNLPVPYLLLMLYPHLYPIHSLDDKNALVKDGRSIAQPPRLPLSAAHVDRHGAYLLDTGDRMYVWVGAAVSDQFCQDVLDAASFHSIVDGLTELPQLENATSERVRSFVNYLNEQRPIAASIQVVREDSRHRMLFVERLVEDRTDSSLSYVEFLQHIQKELKS